MTTTAPHRTRSLDRARALITGSEDTVTSDYAAQNAALFARRAEILAQLEAAGDGVRSTRLRRRLDDVETEIIAANQGLVLSYARRFRTRGRVEDSADFEAAGMVGLVAAMKSYDPTQGPFAQWAYHPIQRAMTRAVRDADFANLNPGDFEKRPDILRARDRLAAKLDRDPTLAEVAAEAGVNVNQVRRVLQAPRLSSMSTPLGGDTDQTVGDLVPSDEEDAAYLVATAQSIEALEQHGLSALDPRELYVIVRHYGLDGEEAEKLASIGTTLGLSREAARQIEARGLAKLGHPLMLRKLVRQKG